MSRSMMNSVRDSFFRFLRKGLRGIIMGHQSSNQYLKLTGMEDLAKDVMWDVLSRLDFKSVSCCKCVCKRWRDLVLDPYFINNLLCANNKNLSLMIHDTTISHQGRLKWIEIQDKVVDVLMNIHDVDLSCSGLCHFPGSSLKVIIGQSVNGLIGVWDIKGHTWIVNPIAKQYLTLPNPQSCSLGYGFGSLDGSCASYKVINIFKKYFYEYTQIEVFTLGSDNWRVLPPHDHFNNIRGDMGGGLFFNSRVHWIIYGGHQLYVFDLHKETFNIFPSPPFEGEEKQIDCHGILGVLKDCLSQGCYYNCEVFTVWVMKEHGVKDSWYKAFTIKETRIARKLSRPLCLLDGSKGGTLIANDGGKLVAYCLETNTIKTINLSSSPATSNIKSVITYHPTFLNLQNFTAPNTPVQTFKMERRQEIWMACCCRVTTTIVIMANLYFYCV